MPKHDNVNTESGPPTSGYSTRKKKYVYSHNKAPYTPAPARNATRPPLPTLASRRKKAGDTTNNQSSNGAQPNTAGDEGNSHHGRDVTRIHPGPSTTAPVDINTDGFTAPQNSLPFPLTNSHEPSVRTLTAIPEDQEAPASSISENIQITSENESAGMIPMAGEPHTSTIPSAGFNFPITSIASNNTTSFTLSTPRRPTQSLGQKTPTVVIFGPAPSWALRFGDDEDSNAAPYASITSVLSDETTQGTNSLPSITDDIPNPPSPPSDPFRDDLDGGQDDELEFPVPTFSDSDSANAHIRSPPITYSNTRSVSAPAALAIQPAHARSLPHAHTFARLHDAVLQSMPPLPSPSMIVAISSPVRTLASPARAITYSTGEVTPTSTSVPASTAALAAVRARPTPPMDVSLSIGPPSSGSHPDAHRESSDPQVTLRQSNFTYEQVASIKAMAKRWTYYLVAEDCFPVNTSAAQEACIKYAENTLSISRRTAEFTRPMWDFVRKKESRVRNEFQRGVIGTVEGEYSVTGNTDEGKAKIAELLSDCNFIYTRYDVNNRASVTGRYRHPCIMSVIKILLFTRTSQGQPVGTHFIRELMSSTPAHLVRQFKDQTATSGAPVPLLALACTIVGDSSTRPVTVKKPINFTEQSYHGHYETFLEKLKGYHRLGELRAFHMEHIIGDVGFVLVCRREYLRLRPEGYSETQEQLSLDDGTERFSDDGE